MQNVVRVRRWPASPSRPLPASFGDSIRQMPDFRDRASRHPQLGPAAATVALHPVAAPVWGGRSHDVKKEENLCVDRCGSCVWCTRDTHRENERCGQGEEDCPDLERTARLGFPPSVRAGRRSRAARRAFIGALLDVTDNVNAAGAIVPPQAVVRRDGDDPLPGGGRGQGHRDVVPISPTMVPPNTISGSVTRLSPAASATTTRRWASPPRESDNPRVTPDRRA